MARVYLLLLSALACSVAALQELEPDVVALEGDIASLRCLIHSNPPPKVTWMFRAQTIDVNAGRYWLMTDGTLVINPVYRSDAGAYICVAENRFGVDKQKVNLVVNGPKPPTYQSCNPDGCSAQWVEGPWGECSQRCGSGGVRTRDVTCQKAIPNGIIESVVPDKECFNLLGQKPEVIEMCNENSACPTWFVGHWKTCDKLCGEGMQTRQVVCHQKNNGRIEELDDEICTEEKPKEEQPCMLEPCDGVDWVTSAWYGCDSCVSKIRTRTVVCSTQNKQAMDERYCAHLTRPVDTEACERDELPACEVHWYGSQWSKCSVTCGTGVQTRKVFCGVYYRNQSGEGMEKVEDAECANLPKYTDTKPCRVPREKCRSQGRPWSSGRL